MLPLIFTRYLLSKGEVVFFKGLLSESREKSDFGTDRYWPLHTTQCQQQAAFIDRQVTA
jgi:hypothetical protein